MTSRRATRLAAASGCSALVVGLFALPVARADVDNCADLIICIDLSTPGGSGGSGNSVGGGSSRGGIGGGSSGGSGEPGFDPPYPGGFEDGGALPPDDPPPADPPPQPTPAEVAAAALAQLQLRKPVVHMNPSDGNLGLVGLPVWLWIDSNDPTRWSPGGISKTLTLGGVTVTVVARSTLVTWDMGDGKEPKECIIPGRPYQGNDEDINLDCTYRYESTSQDQPGSKFPVSATVTWKASYTGPTGTFALDDLSGSAGTTVRVGELQVMNESSAP